MFDGICAESTKVRERSEKIGERHELEGVWGSLPFSIYLDLYLHAFIYVLGSALIVYSELENIAILELEWSRIRIGG